MKKLLELIWKGFLFVSITSLFFGFYYLDRRIDSISSQLGDNNINPLSFDLNQKTSPINETENFICGDNCKAEIARQVELSTATLSAKETKIVTSTIAPKTQNITYVPMGSTFSTQSTGWVTVEDSGLYVDLVNDYGKNAKVSWETSLKVAYGNGKAFARLYDDTNKIAVDFSEVSTEANETYKQVTSGYLPFWRGRNLYKVQIRSLNSFEVTYSGGKLKIVY